MERPTEQLVREHERILQMLDCLERLAAAGTLDPEAATDALFFLRTYADRLHHGKEEQHLFPRMESQGVPREGGPIGVMLLEHEEGRSRIAEMGRAVEDARQGKPGAPERFATHARQYAYLLRQHIEKENEVLFPMAEEVLPEAERASLLRLFAEVERTEVTPAQLQECLEIVARLSRRLGVERGA